MPCPQRATKLNPLSVRLDEEDTLYEPPPASEGQEIILPFNDAWRPLYQDTSGVKCGGFATAIMLAIHYQTYIDPEPIYQRAIEIHPPGPASSPWGNLMAAEELGYTTDTRWFRDVDTARSTLVEGLAFIALSNGHIFCIRGISDAQDIFYVTDDTGSPVDGIYPFGQFQQDMSVDWHICGVGLFV